MLNILSWNIQQGGGSRITKILSVIKEERPAILVFSEFKDHSKGALLTTALRESGYKYQMKSIYPANQNGILIAAKIEFEARHFEDSDSKFNSSVLCARFSAFDLYGCYLPHKKKHELIPFLTTQIRDTDAPAIIVGDLNTGINGVDQKGSSFWYEDELKALLADKMSDAFRLKNGIVREYSWYSHQGNGYRYDHSFISTELIPLLKECYFLHSYRELKYSDHSPMVLKLGT